MGTGNGMGRRNGLNCTNGVFDINKEAVLTVDMVVDGLIDLKIISNQNSDRASEIAARTFLVFRTSPELLARGREIDIDAQSEKLAYIIIGALVEQQLVRKEDGPRAIEVAVEELAIQWKMENS